MKLRAALLAVTMSGCSFVLVDGGPKHVAPGAPAPSCTESMALPYGDMAVGTAAAISGVFLPLLYLAETDDDRKSTLGTMALLAWPVSAVFLGSGVYGRWKVKRCRKAINASKQPAYQPYGQPYGAPPYGQQPYPAPQPYPPPQPQPYPPPQPQPYPPPQPPPQ